MEPTGIEALQEGDILLMMGDGPLSELIAWASDGIYSHAAIVVDGGELIEASLGGVRRYPLERRIVEFDHFHFIDAWRTHDGQGAPVAVADCGLVRRHAQDLLGAPYPVDQLALLGVVMAVRGKWPKHALLRKLVWMAMDRALPAESPAMVCSEVVYRAWAECAAEPRGRLAPRIVESERGTAAFPAIDWKRLYEEIGPLLGLPPPGAQGARGASAETLLASADEVPDELLEQARQRLLAGLDGQLLARTAGTRAAGHHPNPRLVSPQDLANSPSTTHLGRLMQRAG